MKFPLFVGLRYLFSKRQEGFLSLINWFSFVGIILGVVSLICVLSVMNGFHAELRNRILSVIPHVYIEFADKQHGNWRALQKQILTSPYVKGVAPFIEGKAMLSANNGAQGVQLNGVLAEQEKTVSIIEQHMLRGSLNQLQAGKFGIVVGSVLARQLQLSLGSTVKLTVPKVSLTPVGIFPRMRYFVVVGIFEVGAQLDQDQAFIHLSDARVIYKLNTAAQGLRVNLKQAFAIQAFYASLDKSLLPSIKVRTWSQTYNSLFSAISMEKHMVSFLLAVVIAVAAFNIISILSMMVTNKKSEIAVLRTMGASSKEILYIFLCYGLSMAVAGMLIGTLLALPLAQHIGYIVGFFEKLFGAQLFNADIYYISKIPSEIQWSDVVWVNALTFCLVFIGSLYPAYKAAQIEPAQALNYE